MTRFAQGILAMEQNFYMHPQLMWILQFYGVEMHFLQPLHQWKLYSNHLVEELHEWIVFLMISEWYHEQRCSFYTDMIDYTWLATMTSNIIIWKRKDRNIYWSCKKTLTWWMGLFGETVGMSGLIVTVLDSTAFRVVFLLA